MSEEIVKRKPGRPFGSKGRNTSFNALSQAEKLNASGVEAAEFLRAVMCRDVRILKKDFNTEVDDVTMIQQVKSAQEILRLSTEANKQLELTEVVAEEEDDTSHLAPVVPFAKKQS